MKILVSANVPMQLDADEKERRQLKFNNSVDVICKKYLEEGHNFKRGFVFNETHSTPDNLRILWGFPNELNIPMKMQNELAKEWVKLFQ